MAPTFEGFTTELFRFLAELTVNNDRDWFKANKSRYEEHVREPALAFIRAMGPRLDAISPHYVASDKRSGGSLMRVYRDTRFGKDKSPYKTNVGIQFRHDAGKDVHAPGFYLHVSNEEIFLGVGLWHPDKEPLAAIRKRIAEHPDEWRAVRDAPAFASIFTLAGESLKRAPRGFPADHPLVEDLKRKDHIAGCDLEPADLVEATALDLIAARFALAGDYMAFLAGAIGLPF